MDFSDKVVIVTGGSSGIGAASAKLFASHGALVVLVGRNVPRLDQVASECEVKGQKPLKLALDLTAAGSCEQVVRKTIETFKKIDVLVNCAGQGIMTSLFDDDMQVFDELFALNVRVPYRLTQLCVPYLTKTKGNVVNVFGSHCRGRPGMLPFGMFKDAMERFTRAGALELVCVGIRMNAVRTGICRTNFLTNFNVSEEAKDATYEMICKDVTPNNVPIEPEEVARMVVFTASETCPSVNGASLCIDAAAS
ncbi:unnamed protein product [Plutella xylostella]|uniref:(diamondback moth) hypothetical protein n=1 Tax=Plutella xylostella TaxID=51655 RepID=A0A8S4EKB8_PLUXY|nr:unnamed protein product [Plutella xylostella]